MCTWYVLVYCELLKHHLKFWGKDHPLPFKTTGLSFKVIPLKLHTVNPPNLI